MSQYVLIVPGVQILPVCPVSDIKSPVSAYVLIIPSIMDRPAFDINPCSLRLYTFCTLLYNNHPAGNNYHRLYNMTCLIYDLSSHREMNIASLTGVHAAVVE